MRAEVNFDPEDNSRWAARARKFHPKIAACMDGLIAKGIFATFHGTSCLRYRNRVRTPRDKTPAAWFEQATIRVTEYDRLAAGGYPAHLMFLTWGSSQDRQFMRHPPPRPPGTGLLAGVPGRKAFSTETPEQIEQNRWLRHSSGIWMLNLPAALDKGLRRVRRIKEDGMEFDAYWLEDFAAHGLLAFTDLHYPSVTEVEGLHHYLERGLTRVRQRV